MSRGYVTVTEVMPAHAPQDNRCKGVKGPPGVDSKAYLLVNYILLVRIAKTKAPIAAMSRSWSRLTFL